MHTTDKMQNIGKLFWICACVSALICAATLAGSAFAATDWRNAPKERPAAPAPAQGGQQGQSQQSGGSASRGTVNEQTIIIPGGGGGTPAAPRPGGETTVIMPQEGDRQESTANEQNIILPGGGAGAEGTPQPDLSVTQGDESESTANEQNIVVPGGGETPVAEQPDVSVMQGDESESTANEQNIVLPETPQQSGEPEQPPQVPDVQQGQMPGEQPGQPSQVPEIQRGQIRQQPGQAQPGSPGGEPPRRIQLWELMPKSEIPADEMKAVEGEPPKEEAKPDQPEKPEEAGPEDQQKPQGPPAELKDVSKQAVRPERKRTPTQQPDKAETERPEAKTQAEPESKAVSPQEPKSERKPEPKEAQKSDKPKPGEPLRIPPEAVETGDLSFLEGCWQGTRPEYYSKRIVLECFCFNQGGRSGKRRIFDDRGGRKCIGATSADLSRKGVLSVKSEGGRCDDGELWGRAEMICRGEGQNTPCSWVFRDAGGGRQSYEIPFVRVQQCGR